MLKKKLLHNYLPPKVFIYPTSNEHDYKFIGFFFWNVLRKYIIDDIITSNKVENIALRKSRVKT